MASPVARPNGLLILDGWLQTDGRAHFRDVDAYDPVEGVVKHAMLSWDTVGLQWVRFTGGVGGGGGLGGPVTIADGAGVTEGAKADLPWDGAAALATGVAIWKYIGQKIEAVRALLAGTLTVDVTDRDARVLGRVKVFDAVGNVITVAKDLTLTDGSARARIQDSLGAVIDPALKSQLPAALAGGRLDINIGSSSGNVPVDVSDEDTRLLGRAKLLNSAGAVIDPALGATQTDGTQKSIVRGAAKGATVAADVTSTAASATRQPLDIVIYDAAGNPKDPTAIRALTIADIVTVVGAAASDAVVSGAPLLTGARTSDVVPAAMSADGDAVAMWATRKGAPVVTSVRDIVRVNKSIRFTSAAAPVADTICNSILNTDGVDAAGATTFVVTANKRFRLLYFSVGVRTTTAATPWGRALIRMNPAGAAVIGSPIVHGLSVGGTAAVIGNVAADLLIFPEGWEISGTMQIAITFANNVATNVTDIILHGYEYTP